MSNNDAENRALLLLAEADPASGSFGDHHLQAERATAYAMLALAYRIDQLIETIQALGTSRTAKSSRTDAFTLLDEVFGG